MHGAGSALRPLREDLRRLAAKPGSRFRRASSWSATTRRPRSWSTTTSPASIRENEDGSTQLENGRLELFRNFDEHGNPYARPRTLLIDSEQLESGEALDDNFRKMAADEIERSAARSSSARGDRQQAENIADQDLLREVMNTVGKEGRLGESIRCVVSVSMLTEGWDANTVTHVSASAPSARSFCANRSSAALSAASPTT